MSRMEILLVEPNEHCAQLMMDVLEKSDYKVRYSRSGRAALIDERADVTLVSSNLPDMCAGICRQSSEAEQ